MFHLSVRDSAKTLALLDNVILERLTPRAGLLSFLFYQFPLQWNSPEDGYRFLPRLRLRLVSAQFGQMPRTLLSVRMKEIKIVSWMFIGKRCGLVQRRLLLNLFLIGNCFDRKVVRYAIFIHKVNRQYHALINFKKSLINDWTRKIKNILNRKLQLFRMLHHLHI